MSTERNALAQSLRRLPAIAALGELWQQRTAEGETDEEYWSFLQWLDLGSTRGGPPPAMTAVATRHQWAERALAYERAAELQTNSNDGKVTPEQAIVTNLTLMVQIEAAKLLKQSASDPGAVVTLKDMVATINMIAGLQKTALQAESAKADLSKLSSDELRKVLEAQKILQQLKPGPST